MPISLANTDHAFLTGVVAGHLLDRGVSLEPVLDELGYYTAQWTLTVPGADVLAGAGLPIEATIVVLPPSTVDGPRSEDGD